HGRRRRDRDHTGRRSRPPGGRDPDRVGRDLRLIAERTTSASGTVQAVREGTDHSINPSVILAVLALGGAADALLQSLVVPALPAIQKDLQTSTSGVAWVFTAYLLAASVVTPIAGRLGDMFGKKRVLVLMLVGLSAGTLLGALATSLTVMIVARTI